MCSAYSLAVSLSHAADRGDTSDISQVRHFWKQIWSLPVPHKTRYFVWRACREAFPTKVNLARRKVVLDNTCEVCGLMVESTGYVLWDCAKAKEEWSCSKLVGLSDQSECFSFMDLMWKMVITDWVEEEKLARLVTIAWALWFNRNEIRHGGVRKDGKDVLRWANQYLEEYWSAIDMERPAQVESARAVTWLPPLANWFKINVDGTVFASQKATGLGVIIRDDRGRVEAALSKKVWVPLGALEAEAKAFEAGLLLARDIGI